MWRAGLVVIGLAGSAAAEVPVIQPAAIIDTIAAALASPDPHAAKGAGHVIAHIDKADIAAVTAALRREIPKRHWKLLDAFTTDSLSALTIEGATGARATVSFGSDHGEIGVTDRPASVSAPGPCVAIPQVVHEVQVRGSGVDDGGELFESEHRWKLTTTRTFDVDGDGIVDAFVPAPATKNTCPDEASWRVYAMRGSCGHDLGVVGPGWLVPDAMAMSLDASGFRPLVFTSDSTTYGKGHIPKRTTTTTSFGIVKNRYKRLTTKRSGGLCHHCAMTWCQAAAP